jgi:TRAP-type C4-dicarboxylate transport system substrate-binding protein
MEDNHYIMAQAAVIGGNTLKNLMDSMHKAHLEAMQKIKDNFNNEGEEIND